MVTLWAAGVQASPLGKLLGVETDRRGSVIVDEYLNPKGHPEIFICGDLAHVEENGKQIPGVAQPAMQMGDYAAKRIGRLIAHELGSDGRTGTRDFTTSIRAIWRRSGARPRWRISSGRSRRTGADFRHG